MTTETLAKTSAPGGLKGRIVTPGAAEFCSAGTVSKTASDQVSGNESGSVFSPRVPPYVRIVFQSWRVPQIPVLGSMSVPEDECEKAYAALLARVTISLMGRLRIRLGEAQVLAMDAIAKAWMRRDQITDEGKLVAWLLSIAMNEFRGEYRKCRRLVPLDDASHAMRATTLDFSALEIEVVLRGCSEVERRVVQMWCGGLQASEIAKNMKSTPSAIYSLLHRLRRRLKAKVVCKSAA